MFKTVLAALGCATVVAVVFTGPAHAALYQPGTHPNFTHEGRYPQTLYWYHLQQSMTFAYARRTGVLRLWPGTRARP